MNKSVKDIITSPVGKIALIVVLYFVIMGGIAALLGIFENVPIIAVIIGVVMGYFGWQALSKITPNIFLVMPVGGWIAYYVVKGALSFFVGVFVAPYIIAKKIISLLENKI